MTAVLAILKSTALELLDSKKALVTLAAIIVAGASRIGLHVDPDFMNQLVALVAAYVVGQGIADRGKEAALIAAANPAPATTSTATVNVGGPS